MNEKMQERNEEILQTATTFFSKYGYQNTDVQQIADTLKIGKGTIYRHFNTKKDLFLATVDRAMKKMQEYLRKEVSKEPNSEKRVRKALKSYITFIKKHPDLTELFVQERAEFRFQEKSTYFAHRAQGNAHWKEAFLDLFQNNRLRLTDFNKISDTLSNLLYGVMFTKIFQEDTSAFEELSDHSIDMILYGLFHPLNSETP
jgi:AcrR family transcriptional regulator